LRRVKYLFYEQIKDVAVQEQAFLKDHLNAAIAAGVLHPTDTDRLGTGKQ